MSRITASSDIQQVKPEEVQKYVDIFCQNVVEVVNGKLDFQTNFNSQVLSQSFSAADTDTTIGHNLGRVPFGYLVASKTVSSDIYNGSVSATASTITLKASVAPVTVTLVVF